MEITHAPSEYIVIDKKIKAQLSNRYFLTQNSVLAIENIFGKWEVGENLIKCNYIGLNDKDGNKVYEGDVFDVDGNILIVAWNQEKLSYVLLDNGGDTPIPYKYVFSKHPKIGNIYLNPELAENL